MYVVFRDRVEFVVPSNRDASCSKIRHPTSLTRLRGARGRILKLDCITVFISPFYGKTSTDGKLLFSAQDVSAILAGADDSETRDRFTACTREAIGRGAFGCPWMWVRNAAGQEEPFFGSDRFVSSAVVGRDGWEVTILTEREGLRFHFVYKFLDLPYHDVTLLPPEEQQKPPEPKL